MRWPFKKEAKLSDDELELRGRQAKSVLSMAVVREALDGMRERAMERWIGHVATAEREEEWRFVRTIDEFERLLEVAMKQGQAVAKRHEAESAAKRARADGRQLRAVPL